MVSDRGDDLYIEVPFPRDKCTPFVVETVLPLLGREPHALLDAKDAGPFIVMWLERIRRDGEVVRVYTDYQADWDLFCGVTDEVLPDWVNHIAIKSSDLNKLLLISFHKATGLPNHHALYDARANQYAYRPRDGVDRSPQYWKKLLQMFG